MVTNRGHTHSPRGGEKIKVATHVRGRHTHTAAAVCTLLIYICGYTPRVITCIFVRVCPLSTSIDDDTKHSVYYLICLTCLQQYRVPKTHFHIFDKSDRYIVGLRGGRFRFLSALLLCVLVYRYNPAPVAEQQKLVDYARTGECSFTSLSIQINSQYKSLSQFVKRYTSV